MSRFVVVVPPDSSIFQVWRDNEPLKFWERYGAMCRLIQIAVDMQEMPIINERNMKVWLGWNASKSSKILVETSKILVESLNILAESCKNVSSFHQKVETFDASNHCGSTHVIKENGTKKTVKENGEPPKSPKGDQALLDFEKFYQAYPKKEAKTKALASWKAKNPNGNLTEKILSALEAHKKRESWNKEGGKFIPMPATWLNQERYNDDISAEIVSSPGFSGNGQSIAIDPAWPAAILLAEPLCVIVNEEERDTVDLRDPYNQVTITGRCGFRLTRGPSTEQCSSTQWKRVEV